MFSSDWKSISFRKLNFPNTFDYSLSFKKAHPINHVYFMDIRAIYKHYFLDTYMHFIDNFSHLISLNKFFFNSALIKNCHVIMLTIYFSNSALSEHCHVIMLTIYFLNSALSKNCHVIMLTIYLLYSALSRNCHVIMLIVKRFFFFCLSLSIILY